LKNKPQDSRQAAMKEKRKKAKEKTKEKVSPYNPF